MRLLLVLLALLLPGTAIALDRHGRAPGCLAGADPASRVRGPSFLDSGAPGLRVLGRAAPRRWPDGAPITLSIGEGAAAATLALTAGSREQSTDIFDAPDPGASAPRLSFGLARYFRWSVLYDAPRRELGLKPR